MKKSLLILVVAMIAFTASAQISGGLKAGVNLTTQKWEFSGSSESESGSSFHFGGYLNLSLSDAISIQPELLYNSLKISDADFDITTNYLSVPVMFVYGFADNKFNVQVGPQIGFLLSTDPSEIKDADAYKGTDLTLNIGAGASFGKLNITARYGIGLSDINDKWGDIIEESDLTIKNTNIQISLGYRLFGGD